MGSDSRWFRRGRTSLEEEYKTTWTEKGREKGTTTANRGDLWEGMVQENWEKGETRPPRRQKGNGINIREAERAEE